MKYTKRFDSYWAAAVESFCEGCEINVEKHGSSYWAVWTK